MASIRTRARDALLLLAVACQVTPEPAPRPPREPDPRWTAARPPVLGLQVERRVDDEQRFRLVHVDGGAPLAAGSLDACEDALVGELAARWGDGLPNVPLPTLGARQFWADRAWYAGWRVQEHVLTGHGRLLDDEDVRRAWGRLEACRARLEVERVERGLQPRSDELVVLVHGLGRSQASLTTLADALLESGHEVYAFSYPSTRRRLLEHGAQLREVLQQLHGVRRVSFVTHSLGGPVVRAALAEPDALPPGVELGRVVMIAPPSQGSELARVVGAFLPFAAVLGPTLRDLAGDLAALPAPPCPFGVVAGSTFAGRGANPLLEGDDDGVVSVAETLLPGAADVLLVERWHTFIMDDPAVVAACARFLAEGRFEGP